jgi:hypothetical protein
MTRAAVNVAGQFLLGFSALWAGLAAGRAV